MKSEHAVGYLKGCFPSLKGLRQQIDDERDHRRALEWVRTCLVLHTLIFRLEHESIAEVNELVGLGLNGEWEGNNLDVLQNEHNSRQRVARAELKRSEVKKALFDSGLI